MATFDFAGKNVLDAGCGFGFAAHLFSECGANIWGVDASRVMVGCAQAAHPALAKKFSRGNISTLPFRTGQFDLVILREGGSAVERGLTLPRYFLIHARKRYLPRSSAEDRIFSLLDGMFLR